MKKKVLNLLIIIVVLFAATTDDPAPSDLLKVHYIDVGQGDSILVTNGTQSMLIDAGKNTDSDRVVEYIDSLGISKIDYIIGTHPHEDHIGGLDVVIDTFDIGKIIMPKQMATTRTFEDVLNSIQKKGLKVTSPKVGDTYELGDSKFTILSPSGENYSNTNDSSIVLKLEHGSNSFMFTGDAEIASEKEILNSIRNIRSTVLKAGHHGSSTSTSDEFLKAVDPKFAVISVGADNSYGHPHKEVMGKLKNQNVDILRTDELGTVVFTSDGNSLSYEY